MASPERGGRVLAADADAYGAALALFEERGAAHVARPGGTLLEHLRRVYRRLIDHGAGRAVRLAGLCHAVYGTHRFDGRLLADEEAPLLASIIGEEAAGLVRLHADCDRTLLAAALGEDPVVYVERSTGARRVLSVPLTRRLVALMAADELDMTEASPEFRDREAEGLLTMFLAAHRWLSPAAWQDFQNVFGPGAGRRGPDVVPMSVTGLDHFVLTVADIDATVAFYSTALGMTEIGHAPGRRALAFADQKINLHPAAAPITPHARRPTSGSADLCLLTEVPIAEVLRHLEATGTTVEHGPVRRTGAMTPLLSIYVRDPDGNLVEISNALPVSGQDRTGW